MKILVMNKLLRESSVNTMPTCGAVDIRLPSVCLPFLLTKAVMRIIRNSWPSYRGPVSAAAMPSVTG